MRRSMWLLFAALAGCTLTKNAPRSFSFTGDNQAKGLLVGSLTTDDPGNYFSQDVNIFFDPAEDSKGPSTHIAVNDHCKMSGNETADFQHPCGRLFAIVLPAGDYDFKAWNIVDAGGGVIEPGQWTPAKFTIRAGKATYIGNIRMVFDPTLPGSGPADWRGWPKATDMHQRDIPMFLSKYPLLRQDDIAVESLSLDPPSGVCNSGSVGALRMTFC